ncbi:lipase family protein [Nocardia terrae]|nr:lipase family protein [Nocardia terrae]
MNHNSALGFLTRTARRTLLTCAAIVLCNSAAPTYATTSPPEPDPFYLAPADLSERPNGDVLAWRDLTLFGLPLPVSAWQIQFRTTGSDDQATTTITTLIEPVQPWLGPGPRPLTTTCAPSHTFSLAPRLDSQTTLDAPFLAAALLRGWAVTVSDYEGPQSRFLDGVNSGRALLDGIRAARGFSLAALADSPAGIWGYSGGSYAALWAGQLHADYAPDVPVRGVVAGGIPADIPAIARTADGGPKAGLTMLVVAALIHNDPNTGIAALLNDQGHAMLAEVAGVCGTELLAKYADDHIGHFTAGADLLSQPQFLASAQRQEPGGIAPDTPLYLYHGGADEVVPAAGVHALIDRYCAMGASLTQRFSPMLGHDSTATDEALGALNYMGDRFDALTPEPGCTGTS